MMRRVTTGSRPDEDLVFELEGVAAPVELRGVVQAGKRLDRQAAAAVGLVEEEALDVDLLARRRDVRLEERDLGTGEVDAPGRVRGQAVLEDGLAILVDAAEVLVRRRWIGRERADRRVNADIGRDLCDVEGDAARESADDFWRSTVIAADDARLVLLGDLRGSVTG